MASKKGSENNDLLHEVGLDIKSRTIKLVGDIDEDAFYNFSCNMTMLENISNEPINLNLSTGGGEIDYGIAIVERIKTSKCEVHIQAFGFVGSIGIFILASGDKRSATTLTNFLHHEDSYETDKQHKANKAYVKYMENADNIRCRWLAKQTKRDFKFWKDLGVSIDHYFFSEEALTYGLIDEIIEI
jgi:ATP-dependent Clp protease protease subunit